MFINYCGASPKINNKSEINFHYEFLRLSIFRTVFSNVGLFLSVLFHYNF